MGRSVKLGHCICNPKEPCPCDLFKQKNVCLCAGEREEDTLEDVALTRLVENPGCASKISQEELKKALAGLPEIFDPRVLVSASTCDDAGIYKLTKTMALVQSVDVFTPCVDDAYAFGQIAAANSVSDIYAMGGRPLTALSILGFPTDKLSYRVINRMLQGGVEKLREAGTVVLGGHSIKDKEIKFGFAVTGIVHPQKIITNNRARPGDILILTKPLGTGIISFAGQLGKASRESLAASCRSMTELNKAASEAITEMGIKTATDITGFGLMGHLSELACQSQATVEVYADRVPLLEGVLDYARRGFISGAAERNRDYASRFVFADGDVSPEIEAILYDPQTSGGLLIAAKERAANKLLGKLKGIGMGGAAAIGKVTSRSEGKIRLKTTSRD
jgi:selenide,water dikinase